MSRTMRRSRRRPGAGRRFRDGRAQHSSPSCDNHGSCPWCERNRTIQTRRVESAAATTTL